MSSCRTVWTDRSQSCAESSYGAALFLKLTRSVVLQIRSSDYVAAARCAGLRPMQIVFRHVLPNSLTPLVVQFSLSMGFAILTEAGLSFLGLGVQPPDPSWGSMLKDGYSFVDRAPWFPISAGAVITLAVLGASFVGDALTDALDVRVRSALR